jgi:hypothetical protein
MLESSKAGMVTIFGNKLSVWPLRKYHHKSCPPLPLQNPPPQKQNQGFRAEVVAQEVESLLCKVETLSSNPNPTKTNKQNTQVGKHQFIVMNFCVCVLSY